jgi:hypothetical protein
MAALKPKTMGATPYALALTPTLDGGETSTAGLSLVRLKRRKMPKARATTASGDALRPHARSDDRIDYRIPANGASS